MTSVIPAFDHNLVLPPHAGDPRLLRDLSPYPCTTLDLVKRFGTSAERVAIMRGLLDFRARMASEGLVNGFQWLDGSFLENVEVSESRPPNDLDLLTIYWGYDLTFQTNLVQRFPEFADHNRSKAQFRLDHFPIDADYRPDITVDQTRYWIQLFTHNRDGVWKGMLRINLNTHAEDVAALAHLNTIQP
jgi:hypothetical protein